MGLIPGLKAFVAAVIGGIGNIPGAAAGGLILGIIETFVASIHYQKTAVVEPYKDAVAFFILILVLLVKPEGAIWQGVAGESVRCLPREERVRFAADEADCAFHTGHLAGFVAASWWCSGGLPGGWICRGIGAGFLGRTGMSCCWILALPLRWRCR